jgi:hypothetical protein
LKSQVRCVLVVSPVADLCGLYEYALTKAGFTVITFATLPTEPIDADAIVVQLHPSHDARDVSCRLRVCAPHAVLIALTSLVPDTQTPVFETELLLPVPPDLLVEIVSALNRASA